MSFSRFGPAAAAVCLAVVGCNGATPTPASLPDSTAIPEATAPDGVAPPSTAPLTLWTVPQFDPRSSDGSLLASRLSEYESLAGVRVDVQVKDATGRAGILEFLRSTAAVAPAELPEMAIIPLGSVEQAAQAGLLADVSNEDLKGKNGSAFEFARRLAAYDGADVAVPFAVDVVHAVAREAAVPATWTEAGDDGSFALPLGAGGVDQAAALLSLYASAGGDPASLGGAQSVPLGPMDDTLAFLQAAADAGQWDPGAGVETPRDAWNWFLARDAGWAAVSGGVFLPQQANFPGLEWGALPGTSRPATPVGWGWAAVFPIVKDPRPMRGEDLVNFLTETGDTDWIRMAGALPAWPDLGNADWPGTLPDEAQASAEYIAFLRDALDGAVGVSASPDWVAAMQKVVATAAGSSALPPANRPDALTFHGEDH